MLVPGAGEWGRESVSSGEVLAWADEALETDGGDGCTLMRKCLMVYSDVVEMVKLKNTQTAGLWWATPLIPAPGSRGRWISESSRPAWCI